MAVSVVALAIFYCTLTVIGIPGNMLILACYRLKERKVGTDYFIMALASCDLFNTLLFPASIKIDVPSDIFCQLIFFISEGVNNVIVALTLAISFDRYMAVCWPMNRRPTKRVAGVVTAVCILQGALIRIPLFLITHYSTRTGSCLQSNTDVAWVTLYDNYVFPACLLVAVILCTLLYARVLVELRRQARVRKTLIGGVPTRATYPTNTIPTAATSTTSTSEREGKHTALSLVPPKGRVHPEGTSETPSAAQQTGACNGELLATSVEEAPKQSSVADPEECAERSTVTQVGDTTSGLPAFRRVEYRVTLMLGVTTALFFGVWLPPAVIRSVPRSVLVSLFVRAPKLHTMFGIALRIHCINSVINVFVYWALNRRFRDDCRGILGRLKASLLRPCRRAE